MSEASQPSYGTDQVPGIATSRIPRFYRLSVEQRLAYLQRSFNLTNDQIAQLRDGHALRVEHAVNMVENALGVFGVPLGLALNFLVDGHEHLVPMAVEEASIIAAASKAALIIRSGGGFTTQVDRPVMIGQIQVLDLKDAEAAAALVREHKERILQQANMPNMRMVARGGGAFDLETRLVDGGEGVGMMLIVHLLVDVCEAMGANAVNYSCEAAGPIIEKLTGGQVHLRILSNLASQRLARARFRLPVEKLGTEGFSGEDVAQRMVRASRFAWHDPYRACTHNKGIMNGIGAAAVALGQDWRAIEAGGHAYAARDGQYRGLSTFSIVDDSLVGKIEMPMQVGWFGGAVNSHPGVRLLRLITGVKNAKELAGLLAAVGLAQNFGACLALATVGVQKGHMALHARSVALSAGVPAIDVERVAQEMIKRGEVKVAVAEEVCASLNLSRAVKQQVGDLPLESTAPGKAVLFGEHAVVYGQPGIAASLSLGLTVRLSHDPDGPRFVLPKFRQPFPIQEHESDYQLFSQATSQALEMHGLAKAPIAIEIEGELIPGMGLGSSAAFSVALITALRRFKKLDWQRRYTPELFREVQKLEEVFHGSPSGMDAATVLNGGVLWFRNGEPRELLPIRIPVSASGVICIVEPAPRTADVVQQVRLERELSPRRIEALIDEIGRVAIEGAFALGLGDLAQVGELMFANHELLARLGVSTPALDSAVERLREMGALGAKLTGAGAGGAIIALVPREKQLMFLEELEKEYALVLPFNVGEGM